MWIIVAFVVGVAVGVFLEWSSWTRCRRQHTKAGTPSASHNTGSPKLPARCELCELYCICHYGMVIGNERCLKARSQLRASA